MVNVDRVYQKVLALANKEQRGYVTPQEFNLFAHQSQREILDQYFYDLNHHQKIDGNDMQYSDMIALIEEKLGALTKEKSLNCPTCSNIRGAFHPFPNDLYKLGSVIKSSGGAYPYDKIMDQLSFSEAMRYNQSPLTAFNYHNQAYTITTDPSDDSIKGFQVWSNWPTGAQNTYSRVIKITYVKKPQDPKWGYVVVGEKAMYDPSRSSNFELHESEEIELVYKILKLAGVAIKRDDIMKAGQGMESVLSQQEKQ